MAVPDHRHSRHAQWELSQCAIAISYSPVGDSHLMFYVDELHPPPPECYWGFYSPLR